MRLAVASGFATLAAALLISCPRPTRADDATPGGEVELLVRGPDARPAAGADVRVAATHPLPYSGKPPSPTAKADAAGVVQFPWPAGVGRVRVTVPGVGYGASGLFEVVPGRTAKAPLAPLAPFAVLEGTVPADALGPNVTVEVSEHGRIPAPAVSLGEGGRFRAEVPAGRWWVRAVEGRRRRADLPYSVGIAPGQRVTGLTLRVPPPEERRASPQPFVGQPPDKGRVVTWAKGTVRDTAGRPVPRADVWAFAVYHGGIRMYENVKKATADAEGKYEVRGEGGLSMFSASLVAHAPGRPPAWAWLDDPAARVPFGAAPAEPPTPTVDLVLPDRGGRLDVTVVRDGRRPGSRSASGWRA